MKRISYIFIFLISCFGCNTKEPTGFSEVTLNDTLTTLEGGQVTLKSILEKHKGKTIVLDIWASWCGDCIRGLPKVKALKKEYTDVVYLFFSLDRDEASWKRGIQRYEVIGQHYFLPKGKKSAFGDFVNISWIPRYMVINTAGEIVVFDVIEADDEKLLQALKK
ncbi:TlpA disulfide reductase family protein [Flavobacteriaceae bacterium MHTCC 0001]